MGAGGLCRKPRIGASKLVTWCTGVGSEGIGAHLLPIFDAKNGCRSESGQRRTVTDSETRALADLPAICREPLDTLGQ